MPSIHGNGIPTLNNYAEALHHWELAKPWRDDLFSRPLTYHRRKRHMSIRKGVGEVIICRLYETDLVTYHPDGAISLEVYKSMSTNTFLARLLPDSIRTQFSCPDASVVWVHKTGYEHGLRYENCIGFNMPDRGPFKLVRQTERNALGIEWVPSPETPPETFTLVKVNLQRAAKALKARGYYDFRAWLPAALGLVGESITDAEKSVSFTPRHALLRMLEDRSKWYACFISKDARTVSRTYSVLMRELRNLIYEEDDCFDKTELPYLTSSMQANWRRR